MASTVLDGPISAAPKLVHQLVPFYWRPFVPAANKSLSLQRAKAVMQAVVKQGIDASRLTARGFGQEVPIADNRIEEGRAKNRRVELTKQ